MRRLSNKTAWRLAWVLFVVFVAATCILVAVARADTITAKCVERCNFGNPSVAGPGLLVWSFSIGPDSWRVAQRYIRPVAAGEYAELVIDAKWLAWWQQAFGVECVRSRYKWLKHATASTEWSDASPWCLSVGEMPSPPRLIETTD